MYRLIFILTMFSSCINKHTTPPSIRTEYCLEKIFKDTITNYITDTEWRFGFSYNGDSLRSATFPFYYGYFFEINEQMYFTLWGDAIFFNAPFSLDTIPYQRFEIANRIVTVFNKSDINPFYKNCNNVIREKNSFGNGFYDGSRHPKSYRYYMMGADFIIEKLDTLVMDFNGDDFVAFEAFHKDQKRKLDSIRKAEY